MTSASTSKRTFYGLLVLALAGAAAYLYFAQGTERKGGPDTTGSLERECLEGGGTWVGAHAECERVGRDWCAEHGGAWNGCASACRHEPDADACTLQCVQVCTLGPDAAPGPAVAPSDATFTFEGSTVTLSGGRAGGGTPIKTRTWGEPLEVDINDDGQVDQVLVLVRDYPDKELRYYVAAAFWTPEGYEGSDAVYLGDRIALQPPEYREGKVLITYTERLPWEDMATRPSVGKTKRLVVADGEFVEAALPVLDEDAARALAVEKWGDCGPGVCEELRIRIVDDGDGVWYVEAVHDGMADDSVRSVKRIMSVRHVDGAWVPGATLLDVRTCQEDRGQQEYLDKECE